MIAALAAAVAVQAAASAQSASIVMAFEPRTMVENGSLQVIRGQRAVFHLEDGKPVLDGTETGKLPEAHPPGEQTTAFAPPEAGKLAAAIDASAVKRVSVLKVWNGTAEPVSYSAVVFVYRGPGRAEAKPVGVCSVAPGETRTLAWPAPLVGAGLAEFKTGAAAAKRCEAVVQPPARKN